MTFGVLVVTFISSKYQSPRSLVNKSVAPNYLPLIAQLRSICTDLSRPLFNFRGINIRSYRNWLVSSDSPGFPFTIILHKSIFRYYSQIMYCCLHTWQLEKTIIITSPYTLYSCLQYASIWFFAERIQAEKQRHNDQFHDYDQGKQKEVWKYMQRFSLSIIIYLVSEAFYITVYITLFQQQSEYVVRILSFFTLRYLLLIFCVQ